MLRDDPANVVCYFGLEIEPELATSREEGAS